MISIIVPVYNTEKYLYRCIQSILAQTYTDFELLLINDGSTDFSGEICDKYAKIDSRVRVFHKENGGVSSVRNLGLDNAMGELVMFCDSDDYMKPDMCEVLCNTLQNKGADVVICGTEETGGGYWKPERDEDYTKVEFFCNFGSLLQTELLSPPWNKIFKRSKIKHCFAQDVSFGEDLMFNLQYFEQCEKISFITASPYFHEKDNGDSLVVKFNRRRLLDIENVWGCIDDMGSINSKGIDKKYFRDIIEYVRMLFKTDDYSWMRKTEILDEWLNISRITNLQLSEYNGPISNRILLRLLLSRRYGLANILVNWRRIIKI